jgi:hypothetical protein
MLRITGYRKSSEHQDEVVKVVSNSSLPPFLRQPIADADRGVRFSLLASTVESHLVFQQSTVTLSTPISYKTSRGGRNTPPFQHSLHHGIILRKPQTRILHPGSLTSRPSNHRPSHGFHHPTQLDLHRPDIRFQPLHPASHIQHLIILHLGRRTTSSEGRFRTHRVRRRQLD